MFEPAVYIGLVAVGLFATTIIAGGRWLVVMDHDKTHVYPAGPVVQPSEHP
jgi:ribosomal protein S18 acetylase RimI-like enzyme